jgi:hypothetical protein
MQVTSGTWSAEIEDLRHFDQHGIYQQYLALERIVQAEREIMRFHANGEGQPLMGVSEQADKLDCLRQLLELAWQQVLDDLPSIEWTEV